jgi:hypothetical protein
MSEMFSIRIGDQIHSTNDIKIACKWHRDGRDVVVKSNWGIPTIHIKRKGQTRRVKVSSFDKLDCWIRRGWSLDEDFHSVEPARNLYGVRNGHVKNGIRTMSAPKVIHKAPLKPENELTARDIVKRIPVLAEQIPIQSKKRAKQKLISGAELSVPHDLNRLREFAAGALPDEVPKKITYLYHGTHHRNIESILQNGFVLHKWSNGMLGGGVYLGKPEKAKNYCDLFYFKVAVILGRCKELDKVEKMENNPDFESMHLGSGRRKGVYKGWLRNEEWIVCVPELTEVVAVVVK